MPPYDNDRSNLDNADWPLLARFFAGEAHDAERARVEAWIAEDPARGAMVASLRDAWKSASRRSGQHTDVNAGWLRMRARVDAVARGAGVRPDLLVGASATNAASGAVGSSASSDLSASGGARSSTSERSANIRLRRPPVARPWRVGNAALGIAASLIVVVGGAWLVYQRSSGRVAALTPAERTFATRPGERQTIVLDDSTEVVLGVASRLVVAAGYGGAARDLVLDGEALFRVRHDAARPFRVSALGAVTEDLGTEFAIRAYRDSAGGDPVQVVVTAGSVAVRQAGATGAADAVVRAGERAVVSATSAPVLLADADTSKLLAFARGELAFDNAPMVRVAAELERWYGVRVTVASPSLAARHLTAAFASESLDDVLRVVALSVGARVERRDSVVTFRAAGPPK